MSIINYPKVVGGGGGDSSGPAESGSSVNFVQGVLFTRSSSTPSAPALSYNGFELSHPSSWVEPGQTVPGSGDTYILFWMASRDTNGDWTVTQEITLAGTSQSELNFTIQYSETQGGSNPHTTPTVDDRYVRFTYPTGEVSPWIQFEGASNWNLLVQSTKDFGTFDSDGDRHTFASPISLVNITELLFVFHWGVSSNSAIASDVTEALLSGVNLRHTADGDAGRVLQNGATIRLEFPRADVGYAAISNDSINEGSSSKQMFRLNLISSTSSQLAVNRLRFFEQDGDNQGRLEVYVR